MNGKKLTGIALSSLVAASGIALAQAVTQPPEVEHSAQDADLATQVWQKAVTGTQRLIETADLETLQLNATFGYSQAEGAGVSIGLQANEIFRTDDDATLSFGINSARQALGLEIRNDRIRGQGLSRRLAFSTAREKPNQAQGADYALLRTQGALEFRQPLPDDVTITYGLAFYIDSAASGSELPGPISDYFDAVGSSSVIVPLQFGFVRDRLDDTYLPTTGSRLFTHVELGLIGDVRYVRALADYRLYRPLVTGWTLGSRVEFGQGRAFGDDPYPIGRNFVATGPTFVRGFAAGSLGGTRFQLSDGSRGSIGGTQSYLGSLELLYDPVRFENLRLGAFLDVGTVLAQGDSLTLDSLRGSLGIGLSWSFGNGALSLSVAQPFNNDPLDKIENIQLGLSANF